MEQIQAAFSNQLSSNSTRASLHTAALAVDDAKLSGLRPEDRPSSQPLADKHDDVRLASASLLSANPATTRAAVSLLTKMPMALLRPGSRLAKRPMSAASVSVFADHSDVTRRETKAARSGFHATRQATSTQFNGLLKRPLLATGAKQNQFEPPKQAVTPILPEVQPTQRPANSDPLKRTDKEPGSDNRRQLTRRSVAAN